MLVGHTLAPRHPVQSHLAYTRSRPGSPETPIQTRRYPLSPAATAPNRLIGLAFSFSAGLDPQTYPLRSTMGRHGWCAASIVGPVMLYPFEYFDLVRRRWLRARYQARIDEIAHRYPAFKIVGRGWSPSNVGGGTAGHLARGGSGRGDG